MPLTGFFYICKHNHKAFYLLLYALKQLNQKFLYANFLELTKQQNQYILFDYLSLIII